jgi:GNAT superfamily N-acetyltransferase
MEDAEAVARLATQLGYPATAEQIRGRLRVLDGSDDARVFVAEDTDGTAVGWVHVFGRRLLESDPDAEIGGLVVDERLRGRGIGAALMASAEAWARERGYGAVSLRTNVIRTEAHEFYKRLGYQVIKSQFKLRKKLP